MRPAGCFECSARGSIPSLLRPALRQRSGPICCAGIGVRRTVAGALPTVGALDLPEQMLAVLANRHIPSGLPAPPRRAAPVSWLARPTPSHCGRAVAIGRSPTRAPLEVRCAHRPEGESARAAPRSLRNGSGLAVTSACARAVVVRLRYCVVGVSFNAPRCLRKLGRRSMME